MATIHLSALGTDGFVIQGDGISDYAGFSVSSAGDVNGDGRDDLLIGAHANDAGGINAGAAYLIFGKAAGSGTIDLAALAASDGFKIQGEAASDYTGRSVASAGDVNGDGFADLLIGAPYNDRGGYNSGAAYVIFGKASGFGPIDLATLTAAQGIRILGDAEADFAGRDVASAGDVNNDGFGDLIVGADRNDAGGTDAGAAYILFGRARKPGAIDLSNLAATDGFKIQGDAPSDLAGGSVSSAGDVNGDGFGDLLIGAQGSGSGAIETGAAYVIFGKAGGFGPVDLAALAPAEGIRIQGEADLDSAGRSVSAAGDVNGDGFGDILVGAQGNDTAGPYAGAAYVVFGKAAGFGPVDLAALAADDGFKIQGAAAANYAGRGLSSAGDVNGDGYDDILVGADRNVGGGPFAGAAYVIFGKASGFGPVDLADLAAADGFKVQGSTGDYAGFSVSAGDANGDGFSDLIIGAHGNDGGGFNAGAAFVVFGAAPVASVTRIGSTAGQTIRGGVGDDLLDGRDGDDTLFGGDGDDDLLGGAGRDAIHGGGGADALSGGSGNDMLNGGSGGDAMNGGSGNDTYHVDNAGDRISEAEGNGSDRLFARASYVLAADASVEMMSTNANAGTSAIHLTGNAGDNRILGNGGGNILQGRDGADNVSGLGGADRLSGGGGRDILAGGAGADRFVFDSAPSASPNFDRIADYSVPDDTIMLDSRIYAGIADGALAAGAFRSGTAAADASDRIIHHNATGNIFYDADGAGGAAQILFAKVGVGLALTRFDFAGFTGAEAAAASQRITAPMAEREAMAFFAPMQAIGWAEIP